MELVLHDGLTLGAHQPVSTLRHRTANQLLCLVVVEIDLRVTETDLGLPHALDGHEGIACCTASRLRLEGGRVGVGGV